MLRGNLLSYTSSYPNIQADVDAYIPQAKPEERLCFRYHRQCPECRAHSLDGTVEEHTRGKHRGKLYCVECGSLLDMFLVLDCLAGLAIATVHHTHDGAPVHWVPVFEEMSRRHIDAMDE